MNGPHYVYRYFGTCDELLYVGVTNQVPQRFYQHSGTAWHREKIRISTVPFPLREDAEQEERRAIAEEYPKYNEWCNPRKNEHRAGEGKPGRRTKVGAE